MAGSAAAMTQRRISRWGTNGWLGKASHLTRMDARVIASKPPHLGPESVKTYNREASARFA